jgi:hypothetical protein
MVMLRPVVSEVTTIGVQSSQGYSQSLRAVGPEYQLACPTPNTLQPTTPVGELGPMG